jgi:hypothetical protein
MDGDENDQVEAAAELAREIAPVLDSILVTIYPDGDTLDTIRPGDVDVSAANAIGSVKNLGQAACWSRADRLG